jgi:hypothetical protein
MVNMKPRLCRDAGQAYHGALQLSYPGGMAC